jgi:DnaK suppressor protein
MAKTAKMTKKETLPYRKKLEMQRAILAGDMNHMEEEALKKNRQESSGDLSNMPVHLADVSSDNYEQELMLGLMENKGEALSEIESALERIDSGTFGVCEKCQKKIKKARLEAIPYARLCISCQAKSERTSRA